MLMIIEEEIQKQENVSSKHTYNLRSKKNDQ